MPDTSKPQLSLAEMLSKKKDAAPPVTISTTNTPTSWQREISKDSSVYSEKSYVLPASTSTPLHILPEIVIPESSDFIGTRIWDCATYCAKMFEWHRNVAISGGRDANANGEIFDVDSTKILELGAGCGLTAIALHHLVGESGLVVATEYGPITKWLGKCVKENGVLNVEADKSSGRVVVKDLDWFNPDHLAEIDALGPYDTVLMSDCTLNAVEVPQILSIFKRFLTKGVLGIVGVCKERDGTPRFMREAGEDFEMGRVSEFHPEYQSERLEVWTMRLK